MINYEKIGKLIRERRKKLNMTQKELGQCVGVTESSIAKYEKGVTEIPIHKLAMLKMVLGLPDILPGVDFTLLNETIANIILHTKFNHLVNIVNPKIEQDIYQYYSYILESYNISLTKNSKGDYILKYNNPENLLDYEFFCIPSSKLNVIHNLFTIAKKEVGNAIFLSLKSNYKKLENAGELDRNQNQFIKALANGKVVKNLNLDPDQNTKK